MKRNKIEAKRPHASLLIGKVPRFSVFWAQSEATDYVGEKPKTHYDSLLFPALVFAALFLQS